MRWLNHWFKLSRKVSASAARRPAPLRLELEQLEERRVMDVAFHGGPVIPHVQLDAVYYGQDFRSPLTSIYGRGGPDYAQSTALTQYLTTITHSSYLSMLGEYGVGLGNFDKANYVTDSTAPASGGSTTEAQIQSMLQNQITSGVLPTPDGSHVYAVFLPHNVSNDLDVYKTFAGHHNSFSFSQTYRFYSSYFHTVFSYQVTYTVPYIVVPTPGGTNYSAGGNAGSLGVNDQMTVVFSHELAETVTNPYPVTDPNPSWHLVGSFLNGTAHFVAPFAFENPGTGWYEDSDTEEIGDLVNGQYGYLDGYAVQKEWSNVWENGVLPAWDSAAALGTDPNSTLMADYNTVNLEYYPFYNEATSQWVNRNLYNSYGPMGYYQNWQIGPNDYSGWVAVVVG